MRHELKPETLQARDNERPEEDNTTGCEGGARHHGTHGPQPELFETPARRLAANTSARLQRVGERIKSWFN